MEGTQEDPKTPRVDRKEPEENGSDPESLVVEEEEEGEEGEDPAIVIDFEPDDVLHQIVSLNNVQPGPGAQPFAQPQIVPNNINQTVANSGREFRRWLDNVAMTVGLTAVNQVVTYDGHRPSHRHVAPGAAAHCQQL